MVQEVKSGGVILIRIQQDNSLIKSIISPRVRQLWFSALIIDIGLVVDKSHQREEEEVVG